MGRWKALFLSSLLLSATAAAFQAPPRYRDAKLPVEERVRDLLARMTLEEKFWQLFMIPGDLDTPGNDYSHGIFGLQISASTGEGLDELRARLADRFGDRFEDVRLLLPHDAGARLAELYALGAPIDEREDREDGVFVRARLPRRATKARGCPRSDSRETRGCARASAAGR